MSPEMETPKLMWLKRNYPDRWAQAGFFVDLADYLTWRATGSLQRSQCTLGCTWTYLGHGGDTWRRDYLSEQGQLPEHASPIGKSLGRLTEPAARELGLTTATIVGVGLIDAHAGALGVLGGYAGDVTEIGRHLALIAPIPKHAPVSTRTMRPSWPCTSIARNSTASPPEAHRTFQLFFESLQGSISFLIALLFRKPLHIFPNAL